MNHFEPLVLAFLFWFVFIITYIVGDFILEWREKRR